jgi:hypothetical protein
MGAAAPINAKTVEATMTPLRFIFRFLIWSFAARCPHRIGVIPAVPRYAQGPPMKSGAGAGSCGVTKISNFILR